LNLAYLLKLWSWQKVWTPKNLSNGCRKGLAVSSIIIGAAATGIPDPIWSKAAIAIATGLNAASLYLLNDGKKA
jgi:hypothetical protein